MARTRVHRLIERYRHGGQIVFTRSEFEPAFRRDVIVFVAGSFGLLILATVAAAAGFAALGFNDVARGMLIVLPAVVFIGTVVTTWEVLRYWLRGPDVHGRPTPPERALPGVSSLFDIALTIVSIFVGIVALFVVLSLLAPFI